MIPSVRFQTDRYCGNAQYRVRKGRGGVLVDIPLYEILEETENKIRTPDFPAGTPRLIMAGFDIGKNELSEEAIKQLAITMSKKRLEKYLTEELPQTSDTSVKKDRFWFDQKDNDLVQIVREYTKVEQEESQEPQNSSHNRGEQKPFAYGPNCGSVPISFGIAESIVKTGRPPGRIKAETNAVAKYLAMQGWRK